MQDVSQLERERYKVFSRGFPYGSDEYFAGRRQMQQKQMGLWLAKSLMQNLCWRFICLKKSLMSLLSKEVSAARTHSTMMKFK